MAWKGNNSMRVRPAIPTDSDAWRLLWKGYQDYYEVDLSDSTEDTWARLLAEESNGPLCLVCEDEGDELVGFATWTPPLTSPIWRFC